MLVAHGIGGGPGVAARHAARLAADRRFGAVRVACLHGEPSVEAVLGSLVGYRIEIVPLLIADGHTMAKLRRRLGARTGARLHAPLGTHRGIDDLILNKARVLCAERAWPPGGTTLLLIGHGSARHPESGQALRRHMTDCAASGGFADVVGGFLDEPPRLAELVGRLAERPCVAVGLFMDEGPHGRGDVVAALRRAAGPIAYAGPIGADARLAALILDGVASAEPAAA